MRHRVRVALYTDTKPEELFRQPHRMAPDQTTTLTEKLSDICIETIYPWYRIFPTVYQIFPTLSDSFPHFYRIFPTLSDSFPHFYRIFPTVSHTFIVFFRHVPTISRIFPTIYQIFLTFPMLIYNNYYMSYIDQNLIHKKFIFYPWGVTIYR